MPKQTVTVKLVGKNCKTVEFLPPFVVSCRQTGGSEERHDVEIGPDEEVEASGSRGKFSFKLRFDKKDKNEATATVLSATKYDCVKSEGKFAPVLTFETRGMEIIAFKPRLATVESSRSKERFEEVDLSTENNPDGFVEWDEKGNCEVSVSEIEVKIV